uniref:Uncharacterized protein n=1 Tax=Romanomermis culicivorax TaxID=13658 RepID=A0A915KG85_ROMCU
MDRHSQESHVVKSKPIDRKILQKLPEFHKPRDFVRASKANQDEFYGGNRVSSSASKRPSPLSTEEKNKIAAKILRAEMLGDTAKNRPDHREKGDSDSDLEEDQPSSSSTLLTKTDLRSGLVYPVKNIEADDVKTRPKRKFNDDFSMKDLLEMEKFTTAEDQLALFGANSAKAISSGKTNDDWTVDDVLEEKMGKKSKKSKSKRSKEDRSDFDQAVKGNDTILLGNISYEISDFGPNSRQKRIATFRYFCNLYI